MALLDKKLKQSNYAFVYGLIKGFLLIFIQ